MKKLTKNDAKPRLRIARETLRVLDTADLTRVVGGVARPLFGTQAPATDAEIC